MNLPDRNKIKSFFNFEMTKVAAQKLNIAANIFLIALSILTGIILIQNYFFGSSSASSQSAQANINVNTEKVLEKTPAPVQKTRMQPTIGAKVDLPEIDFSQNQKTLILALRQGCHFCTDSGTFYKRLIQEAKNKNIKLIAVLPTGIDESKVYLKTMGIAEIEVKQALLKNLQVPGTPTLILANGKGEVTDFWIGKLSDEKEREVLNKI